VPASEWVVRALLERIDAGALRALDAGAPLPEVGWYSDSRFGQRTHVLEAFEAEGARQVEALRSELEQTTAASNALIGGLIGDLEQRDRTIAHLTEDRQALSAMLEPEPTTAVGKSVTITVNGRTVVTTKRALATVYAVMMNLPPP